MTERRYPGLTPAQEAMLVAFTDQRCANLLACADFVADLPEAAKDFLMEAKPETLKFLKDARDVEIAELANGIELVRAVRMTSRIMRILIITMFSVFVGVMMIWDKLAGWLKTAPPK